MSYCGQCGVAIEGGRYCYLCTGDILFGIDVCVDEVPYNEEESESGGEEESTVESLVSDIDEDKSLVVPRLELTRQNKAWIIAMVMIGIGAVKLLEHLLSLSEFGTFLSYQGTPVIEQPYFWIMIYSIILVYGVILWVYGQVPEGHSNGGWWMVKDGGSPRPFLSRRREDGIGAKFNTLLGFRF